MISITPSAISGTSCSNNFLTNAGTGTFIAGQDVEETTKISFVNNAGYISGITSSDVTTALGYTPYDSSNPNGYTSNIGTVTSVNNVSPVSGDVTLTASDIGAQEALVSGTNIKTINNTSLLGSGDIDLADNTLSNVSSIDNGSAVATELNSKADTDLSNLSSTGQAIIDAKVNKSGDTMTGALAFERTASAAIDYKRTDYTIGDSASSGSQINVGAIATYDSNGSNVSVIQTRALDNGSTGFQFALQKHDLSGYHSFGMNETTSGTAEFFFPKSYNVDGQWVNVNQVIASNVNFNTVGSEIKTYSLASYLPDDNYTYEVLFTLGGQTAATSGASFGFALITDIVSNVFVCRNIARSNAYVNAYGSAIVPLKTKQIQVQQVNNTSSTPTMTTLRMCAYRRVGTNT